MPDTKFVESDHTRAAAGTFAAHTQTPAETSLKAESRIPSISDWAHHLDEFDPADIQPTGPNGPVEYVLFHAGPYAGQVMPTQADGDPLPAGQAPTQNYLDARDEIARAAAEAAAEAGRALAEAARAEEAAKPLAPAGYVRRLVDGGMDEPDARVKTAALMMANMNRDAIIAGRDLLNQGNETTAAMFVIAQGTVKDLPQALVAAGGNLADAEAAFADAKRQLRSTGQMFDMMSGRGQDPVFQNFRAMVDEAHELLTCDV